MWQLLYEEERLLTPSWDYGRPEAVWNHHVKDDTTGRQAMKESNKYLLGWRFSCALTVR